MIEFHPSILAAADQELSSVDNCLDQLIAEWKAHETKQDWKKNDRVFKVAEFMADMSVRDLSPAAAIALLTAAVEKLADG